MPELPEVETIARGLRPRLVGLTITAAELHWERTLATPTPREFRKRVLGQQILEVGRRAKFLNLRLSDYSLLIHLRMSGDLYLREQGEAPEKHDRLRLSLLSAGGQSSQLVFNDARKFGRVWFTPHPELVLGGLGPEPLGEEFTAAWLHAALHRRHRQIKPLLLDQSFLAGLGNIYTDEALHRARLHPLRLSDSLRRRQVERLWEAIRAVLEEGIRCNGASFDRVYRGGEFQNHFRVYDREGQACPVCGATIKRLVIGQRGTHFCPRCQRME
ncbi:MAG: bifunctional DNA-formamidopyrimidine glycosylase/DNA-(apurinic or apyrimidinic site) lyase [Bacteroidota bacterium]